MSDNKAIDEIIRMLDEQLDSLNDIVKQTQQDNNYDLAMDRLGRWKKRTVGLIRGNVSEMEGEEFENIQLNWNSIYPGENILDEAKLYSNHLVALKEEISNHPESINAKLSQTMTSPKAANPLISNVVFIVHGHDELNLRKLEKLLHDRFKLNPIILLEKPGVGRTLIEKFEQEATKASFSFVIFTPDDFVESGIVSYAQARPNVFFELGWFYGRLSRERVCILYKKGTIIPTDLKGISSIEFNDSIEEKIIEIEKELKAAGLI